MIKLNKIFGTKTTLQMFKNYSNVVTKAINFTTADQTVDQQPLLTDLSIEEINDYNDHQNFCQKYHQLLDFIGVTYLKTLALKPATLQYSSVASTWLPISESTHIKYTLGYYGQAWINHELKQIIIVSAGTKFDSPNLDDSPKKIAGWLLDIAKDSFNDLLIYIKQIPYQFQHGAIQFVDNIVNVLQQQNLELSEYNICFTGHSLGGVLSELTLTYVINNYQQTFKDVQSVTFDNPGSKPLIEQYLQSQPLSEQYNITDLGEIKNHCITFNHTPNWLNSVHAQAGVVYQVRTNMKDKTSSFFDKISLVSDFLSHIANHDKANFRQATSFEKNDNWHHGLFNQDMKHNAQQAIQNIVVLKDIVSNKFNQSLNYISQTFYDSLSNSYSEIGKFTDGYKDYIPKELSSLYEIVDLFCLGLQNGFDNADDCVGAS